MSWQESKEYLGHKNQTSRRKLSDETDFCLEDTHTYISPPPPFSSSSSSSSFSSSLFSVYDTGLSAFLILTS